MNNRGNAFKKMAIDARLLANEYNGFDPTELTQKQLLFAELIVLECIRLAGPEDSYTDEWFKAKADSVNKIKQQFGIDT